MTILQNLWDERSGTLSLREVESKFFPKASSSHHIVRSSTSRVTSSTYKHSVKILQTLDPQEYTDIFDRLAQYAMDRTPPPSPVTWNYVSKLVREVGLLTKDVLRHVVFWFEGDDVDEIVLRTPSGLWSDLLAAGTFATRPSLNGGSLMHANQPPGKAAGIFVQALFDQIRAGLKEDWKDEATNKMVRLLLFHGLRILTGEGPSTSKTNPPQMWNWFRKTFNKYVIGTGLRPLLGARSSTTSRPTWVPSFKGSLNSTTRRQESVPSHPLETLVPTVHSDLLTAGLR